MASKWIPPDADELVHLYLSGMSQDALATRYGVTRIPIRRALVDAGVPIRGTKEVNRRNAANRTPEQNRRITKAANAAARGRKATTAEREKVAQTRERKQSGVTATERYLADMLAGYGWTTTLQKAVGAYNIDVALSLVETPATVAVEIFGGNWHGSGRHVARAPKRFRHLLDEGWPFIIVWTDFRHAPLTPAAAEHIDAFAQEVSFDPSKRREYRVIWGTGEAASPAKPKLDQIANVPSLAGRNR